MGGGVSLVYPSIRSVRREILLFGNYFVFPVYLFILRRLWYGPGRWRGRDGKNCGFSRISDGVIGT